MRIKFIVIVKNEYVYKEWQKVMVKYPQIETELAQCWIGTFMFTAFYRQCTNNLFLKKIIQDTRQKVNDSDQLKIMKNIF